MHFLIALVLLGLGTGVAWAHLLPVVIYRPAVLTPNIGFLTSLLNVCAGGWRVHRNNSWKARSGTNQ